MMLVEDHAVEPQFLAQHLFVQIFVVQLSAPGRIEMAVGCSEESPADDLLVGEIAIWALSEIT